MKLRRHKYTFILLLLFLLAFLTPVFISNQGKESSNSAAVPKASANEAKTAKDLQTLCSASSTSKVLKGPCYIEEFKKITLQHDAPFAFSVLSELQKYDPDTRDCHLIAHSIGYGIYERNPGNVSEQISKTSSNCGYGATMGLVELYVKDIKGDKMSTVDALMDVCGAESNTFCNHIVGHMVIVETENDVPEAIKICDRFEDKLRKQGCAGGVFMEHIVGSALVTHNIVPNSWRYDVSRFNAIEKLCRSQSDNFINPCWQEISEAAINKFDQNPKDVFDFCNTAPSTGAADACIRRSINIFAAMSNYDLEPLKSICNTQQPDPTFKEKCYAALVEYKLIAVSSENAVDTVDFCGTLKARFKHSCFRSIGDTLKRFSRLDEAAVICRNAPAEFKSECSGN